jgi:hypothetical protein
MRKFVQWQMSDSSISLAPGFSPVIGGANDQNRFNGFPAPQSR